MAHQIAIRLNWWILVTSKHMELTTDSQNDNSENCALHHYFSILATFSNGYQERFLRRGSQKGSLYASTTWVTRKFKGVIQPVSSLWPDYKIHVQPKLIQKSMLNIARKMVILFPTPLCTGIILGIQYNQLSLDMILPMMSILLVQS